MLILSRKPNETLMIDDDIQITLLSVNGNQARIGITAPSHIPVHRKEIWEKIQEEKKENIENEDGIEVVDEY